MKKLMLLALCVSFTFCFSQTQDEKDIRKVMDTFLEAVNTRDNEKFNSLFHEHVLSIGNFTERTQKSRIKNGEKGPSYFLDDYKTVISNLKDDKSKEKFDNIKIIEDGTVASANFDYSFWYDGKMTDWGREIWTLLKIDGKWKITSITYSMELTKYYPQPPLKNRLIK